MRKKRKIYKENLKSIAMKLIHLNIAIKLQYMEPSGIEPPFMPCESIVLPLNHGPIS